MSRFTVVTFSVFSLFLLFMIFHSTDGKPSNSLVIDELSANSESGLDTALTTKYRRKRAILDPITGMMSSIIGAPFHLASNAISIPFHMISNIFGVPYNLVSSVVMAPIRLGRFAFRMILIPFRFIYDTLTWPIRRLFNRDNDPKSRSVSPSVNTQSTDTSGDVYSMIKTNVLPSLDKLLVNMGNSPMMPDNTKQMFNQMHSMYQMLHMIKVL